MGRRPCCAKEMVKRGAWSALEDRILSNYVKAHGEGKWRDLPRRAGLSRCGKSCRLRWLNYLRPGIKRGNISTDEEELIIRLHRLLGNRWSLIAGRLPGRTDNEIKNYWNTYLSKKSQDKTPQKGFNHPDKEKKPVRKSTVEVPKAANCSTAIRTKARRSTTQVVLPEEDGKEGHQSIKTTDQSTAASDGGIIGENLSSSAGQGDDCSDFLKDFDSSELFMSDFLGQADLLQVHGEGIKENNNLIDKDMVENNSSTFSAYNNLLSSDDVILEDSSYAAILESWLDCDSLQPNEDLEINRLACPLDLKEERK
ncbi:PREDICTED: transcription repressor MYB6-like [Nelumbo nucifera]|uniref:Uncharacterized protein n=2 Tax=Nelumbo nucifera TaxID=4432 RepID=A0A822YME5_NELNU|nr:PREDICTED: transcription repressor MYB6-like [Nelumbo nucifera]DAD32076.1 TPA_asm: hypothetical protein HUJ06_010927 [Nelumbo nucifera]